MLAMKRLLVGLIAGLVVGLPSGAMAADATSDAYGGSGNTAGNVLAAESSTSQVPVAAPTPATKVGGRLPFTGVDLLLIGFGGLSLILVGMGVRRLSSPAVRA